MVERKCKGCEKYSWDAALVTGHTRQKDKAQTAGIFLEFGMEPSHRQVIDVKGKVQNTA